MSVDDILVHVGTPYRETEAGPKIEGERDITSQRLTPFACCLFLPLGQEDQGGSRSRQVSRPTLLYAIRDVQGQPVRLDADDNLYVRAPELAPWVDGLEEALWQVDGMPQPAGRPGEDPVVVQARLVRVGD